MSSLPITASLPARVPAPRRAPAGAPAAARPVPRRVRHQARESLAVMVLSVTLSGGFSTAIVVLSHLGR